MLTTWLQKWGARLPWLRNRNVFLLVLASALSGFTVDGGIFSVIFNLYLLRFHYTSEVIGQINSVAELTLALTALPMGTLGARWGSRNLMVIGAALALIGALVISAAGSLPSEWRMWGLMAGKAIIFWGLASFYVNSVPFSMAVSTPANRASIFAAQSALSHSGAVIGALLGGALPGWYVARFGGSLDQPEPYRAPLLVVAFVMLLLVLVFLAAKEPTENESAQAADQPSPHTGAPNPTSGFLVFFILITIVRLFQIGGISSVSTFINVYLDEQLRLDSALIGAILASARLIAIPAVLLVPWLSRRWPRPWVSFTAAMIMALCTGPLALLPVWWVVGITYVIFQSSVTIRYSSFIVYLMEQTPPHRRGFVAGAGEMAAGFSAAVAALLGGYIITRYGYAALFLNGGLLMALGTLAFGAAILWQNRQHRE